MRTSSPTGGEVRTPVGGASGPSTARLLVALHGSPTDPGYARLHPNTRLRVRPPSRVAVDLTAFADPDLRRVAEETVAREVADTPAIAEYLHRVGTDDALGEGNWAMSSRSGALRFHAGLGDPAVAEGIVKRESETPGWASVAATTPAALVRRTVVHEVGHQLAYSLPEAHRRALLKSLFEQFGWGTWSGDTVTVDRDAVARDLSIYAAKTREEVFAEGWAEYRLSPNPRPAARLIGSVMSKYGGRVGPPGSGVRGVWEEPHPLPKKIVWRFGVGRPGDDGVVPSQ